MMDLCQFDTSATLTVTCNCLLLISMSAPAWLAPSHFLARGEEFLKTPIPVFFESFFFMGTAVEFASVSCQMVMVLPSKPGDPLGSAEGQDILCWIQDDPSHL